MLTVDLVRFRRKDGRVCPMYLTGAAVERLLPVAGYYIEVYAGSIGATRDAIDEAIKELEVPARDRIAALGLRKVVDDRSTFEVTEGVDPEELRDVVFSAAAAAHKALDVRAEFDRDAVLTEVAGRLGKTPEAIEAELYADLRGSEILKSFASIAPEAAVERYNLGMAQAALLRAVRVTVRLEREDPRTVRRLFRAARFHQLIHVVRGNPEDGYTIELDGPFSLFDSVQRYGFRLALFLPAVLACSSYHVRADVLLGKDREPGIFEIRPEDGLVSHTPDPPDMTPELEVFQAAFGRLDSEWSVRPNERIFALPGEVVCVPDLVFERRGTGEEVYLEVFGFWSRAAVWRRVEQLQRGGIGARILLAVAKHLRVSEEVLSEEDAGEVYVYKTTISPRAILERLTGIL